MTYLVEILFSYLHKNIVLHYIINYVNVIIIKIKDLISTRISTCIGHLQRIVER